MSLEYEDLRDAKTRLKESFDANKTLGVLVYTETRDTVDTGSGTVSINESTIWCVPHSCNITQRKVDDASEARERTIRFAAAEGEKGKGKGKGKRPNAAADGRHPYDRLLVQIKSKGEQLGRGTAALKPDAQQRAAAQAIEALRKKGMYKGPPEGYDELIKPL
jgi:hypothetical protein